MSSIVGVIKAGWIVKSPPESRLYSALSRIYQAKWRRRWFVLLRHENVPRSELPFELLYYEDDTCKKCKGKINLSAVHEIVVNFESDYDKTFALKTMHRHRDRTYYLTATDREDMLAWVRMLCVCCGLSQQDGAFATPPADATSQPATGANGSPTGTPGTISARAATAPASLERSRAFSPPAPSFNQSLPAESDENCSNELRTRLPPRKTPNGPLDSPRPAASARRHSDVRPENDENNAYVNAAPTADPPPVPLKRHDTASAGTLRRPSITPAPTPTPARADDEYVVLTDCRSGTDVTTPPAKPWPRRHDDPSEADYQPAPLPRPFGAPDFIDPDSDYLNVPAVSATASFAAHTPADPPAVLPKSLNSLSRTRLLARSDADGLHDVDADEDSPANNYVRPPDVSVPVPSPAHALTPLRLNQSTGSERTPEMLPKQTSARLAANHSASPKNSRLFATPSKTTAVRSPLANCNTDDSLDAESDSRLRSHASASAAESYSGYLNVPPLPAKPRPQSPSVPAVTNGLHTTPSSSGRPTVALPKPTAKSTASSSDDDRSEDDDVEGDESTFRSPADRAANPSSIVFGRSNASHAYQTGSSNARAHANTTDDAHWRAQTSSASTLGQRAATTRIPTQQTNVTNGVAPRREFGYAELDLPQTSADLPAHLASRTTTYLDPSAIDFERTNALAKLLSEREKQLERPTTPVQMTASTNASLNASRNGLSGALTPLTTGTGSRKAK